MAPLVDPSEWEDYSKSPAPENAATLLDAASAAIRDVCGWNISREVVEHALLDSWGTTLFKLPTMKLVSVDYLSIEFSGQQPTNLIEREDFIWSTRGSLRLLRGNWPWNYQGVDISYTHGYLHAEIPASIKMLCVSLTKRVEAAPAGVLAEAVGGTNIQYGDRNSTISLTDAEIGVLGPYILESRREN